MKPIQKATKRELTKRTNLKRSSIYSLKENLSNLKRHVLADLRSSDEKDKLTALIIRIMIYTSERVGNEDSASNGHFGVTQFKPKHVKVVGNQVMLDYVGKSGVDHEKSFSDEASAKILKVLLKRNNKFLFTTEDGFRIKPDRVNRYLRYFDAKSKDIRGYNANHMMVMELNRIGRVSDEKERVKVWNETLRKIAKRIGHGAATLKTHYLMPEIFENFSAKGSVKSIKID